MVGLSSRAGNFFFILNISQYAVSVLAQPVNEIYNVVLLMIETLSTIYNDYFGIHLRIFPVQVC